MSGVAGHLCHLSLGAGRGFWRVAEIKKDMVGRIETNLIKLNYCSRTLPNKHEGDDMMIWENTAATGFWSRCFKMSARN